MPMMKPKMRAHLIPILAVGNLLVASLRVNLVVQKILVEIRKVVAFHIPAHILVADGQLIHRLGYILDHITSVVDRLEPQMEPQMEPQLELQLELQLAYILCHTLLVVRVRSLVHILNDTLEWRNIEIVYFHYYRTHINSLHQVEWASIVYERGTQPD